MAVVTVIIPNRDRDEPAFRAARSVLEQQVDLELIVVDDASVGPPEDLYAWVEGEGHTVLRRSKRCGPGAARNLAAGRAKGRWLAFLDSDDHWLPGKLSAQLDSFERSGLRIGQVEEIWYRDGVRVNPPKPHRISGGDLLRRSLRSVCVSSSSVMLERSLFEEMGGFDEELFVCEDYEFWLRVAARWEFDYCPEALVVKYGGHEDQLSKALPAMDRFRILGLVKNLGEGRFGERAGLALSELERKLRILGKGSGKRDNIQAVELCSEIGELAVSGEWEACLAACRQLVSLWPIEP